MEQTLYLFYCADLWFYMQDINYFVEKIKFGILKS